MINIPGRFHRMSLLTVSPDDDGIQRKDVDLGHGQDTSIVLMVGPGHDVEIRGLLFHPDDRRNKEWFIDPDDRVLVRDYSDVSPNGTVECEVSPAKALEVTDIGPPAYI